MRGAHHQLQRGRGEDRVAERRVEGPGTLGDAGHNLSERYPQTPSQHRRQGKEDGHGRRASGWLNWPAHQRRRSDAVMSSLVAAAP